MVKRCGWALLWLCVTVAGAMAQDLPGNELQVALNSYFDNFNVKIYYPTVSLTRRFSDSSTVSVRYLVDVISAASMRSHFDVDGVSSATPKDDGGGDDRPDEIRHEVGVGVNELVAGGLLRGGTFSLNALYSKEHDYCSITLAGLFTYLMAKKNTTLQLGFVRSWDRIFPQIRQWERTKDVYTVSVALTQILSPVFLAQVIYSYNDNTGYLSDPYQVVRLIDNGVLRTVEPVHPDRRIRRAVGLRMNYKAGKRTALQFGVRYYWDSWDIHSLTTTVDFRHYLNRAVLMSIGLRNYIQGRAFFFKPQYDRIEPYMTVDTKLNENWSNNYQLKFTLNGGYFRAIPFLADEHTQVNIAVNFYHRHSATPDWHSRYKNLYAYLFTFGIRYHF